MFLSDATSEVVTLRFGLLPLVINGCECGDDGGTTGSICTSSAVVVDAARDAHQGILLALETVADDRADAGNAAHCNATTHICASSNVATAHRKSRGSAVTIELG